VKNLKELKDEYYAQLSKMDENKNPIGITDMQEYIDTEIIKAINELDAWLNIKGLKIKD
jgi:hypothetical protein